MSDIDDYTKTRTSQQLDAEYLAAWKGGFLPEHFFTPHGFFRKRPDGGINVWDFDAHGTFTELSGAEQDARVARWTQELEAAGRSLRSTRRKAASTNRGLSKKITITEAEYDAMQHVIRRASTLLAALDAEPHSEVVAQSGFLACALALLSDLRISTPPTK